MGQLVFRWIIGYGSWAIGEKHPITLKFDDWQNRATVGIRAKGKSDG
jgi:hypothetical protein